MGVSPEELIAFLTGGEVTDETRRAIGQEMEDPDSPVSRVMQEIGRRSSATLTDDECSALLEALYADRKDDQDE